MVFTILNAALCNNPKNVHAKGNNTEWPVSFYMGQTFMIAFDNNTNKFYAVQYKTKPSINLSSQIKVVESAGRKLTLKDEQNGSIVSFSLEPLNRSEISVYGIIYFHGNEYETQLLKTNANNKKMLDPTVLASLDTGDAGAIITAMRCFCAANGSNNGCDHGGTGSNQCSVTHGGSVGIGWENSCSVACGSGYYACCNKE